MNELLDHDTRVATMTGGMVPDAPNFGGSERLHPDGRPKGEFRDELRKIPNLKNSWTVLSSLSTPIFLIWGAITINHPLSWIAAALLMGISQNRLFILHHEAAHRTLFSNRKINDLIGINVIGLLTFGTGSHGYRIGHMNHHRDEFGPKEPDFLLYSFYPISKSSMRRKVIRDAAGVSAIRILRPRFLRLNESRHRILTMMFLFGQAAVYSIFALTGHPWLYLFLWIAPWAFIYQVLNRLRAIAEHGGMTRAKDRRCTTHQVNQSLLARALITPVGVGYHLAHHVDMTVPWRNLALLHQALVEDGYLTKDLIWPNYRTLWKSMLKGTG